MFFVKVGKFLAYAGLILGVLYLAYLFYWRIENVTVNDDMSQVWPSKRAYDSFRSNTQQGFSIILGSIVLGIFSHIGERFIRRE